MTYPDIIASIGVTLLLIGFFLNLRKTLSTDSVAYSILNILGAGLCGISSYMISFYPFVILESVWVVVAMVPLLKKNVSRETYPSSTSAGSVGEGH